MQQIYPAIPRGASSRFLWFLILCFSLSATLSGQQLEWSPLTTQGVSPESRHESGFVKVENLFYLLGGRGTKTIQVYDPVRKKWSNTKTKLDNIHHFQARAFEGKIYLIGAMNGNYPNENPLANVLIYDPQQDKLTTGATIPAGRRRGSSGVVEFNGNFYIFAGNRNGHSAYLDNSTTPANVAWVDKYNPKTDTWTILPDAPHARDHFFAERIDYRIYLAGGRRSKVGTPAGTWSDTETAVDVFDLITEQWISGWDVPDPLPTARAGAATAVLNNELMLIGGEVDGSELALPHTEILNPTNGTWRREADLALQRHGTQAIVYNDDVFVAGGSKTKGGGEISSNEAFIEAFTFGGPTDKKYSKWTTINASPQVKAEAGLVTYGGEYYVFHGLKTDLKIANTVEKYNPLTNTWASLAPMPEGKGVTHNGTALVDDDVWIAGGRLGAHPGPVTDEVWIYNIPSNSWRSGPTLPVPAGGGGLARLGSKLHYVGGFDPQAQCDVDLHLVYDLENPGAGWQDRTAESPLPMGRNHLSAITYGGKLYIIGGQYGHDGCQTGLDLRLVHVYDPVTDEWARLADLPGEQSHAEQSTFVHDNKFLMVGGDNSTGKRVFEYDPATNKWTTLRNMELPETLVAPAVRVYNGKMIVMNGGQPSTATPINTTMIKDFVVATNPTLAFNPGVVNVNVKSGQAKNLEVLLSNLNGEASTAFALNSGSLPKWLAVTPSHTVVRESDTEIKITASAAGLAKGTYSFVLNATAPGYQQAQLTVNLIVDESTDPPPPPAVDDFSVYLEAECGTVGSNWVVGNDAGASRNQYVVLAGGIAESLNTPPANVAANRISFSVNLPDAGEYRLFSRLRAPSGLSDSYWVRVNGGPWIKWWEGVLTGDVFDWRKITNGSFNLPAGTATIQVAYREAGTQLDKVFLTNTAEVPSGKGGDDTNCGTAPPPPPPPANPEVAIRINAGGPTVQYDGQEFVADTYYSGGKVFTNPWAPVPDMYKTERSAGAPYQFRYEVPVPDGEYLVRLHFADIYNGVNGGGPGGVGKRIFDVSLEGGLILDNYDINADVGPGTVTVKDFPLNVKDGAVSLFFDASRAAGGVDQPKVSAIEVLSRGGTPIPQPVNDFWAEAECATGGGQWAFPASAGASAGRYARSQGGFQLTAPANFGGESQLTWTVNLARTATYHLFLRMNAPGVASNSFWVSVDDQPWIEFWRNAQLQNILTSGFEWKKVLDDGYDVSFDLSAGNHTIRVASREPGTGLDKIYLGTSPTPPGGQGGLATSCSTTQRNATVTGQPTGLEGQLEVTDLRLFPNPVTDILNYGMQTGQPGTYRLQVTDFTGRLLQEQSVQSQVTNEIVTGTVDVSDWPAGTYRLRVIDVAGGTVSIRAFVKIR